MATTSSLQRLWRSSRWLLQGLSDSHALRPSPPFQRLVFSRGSNVYHTRLASTTVSQEWNRLADFTCDEKIDTTHVQIKLEDGHLEEPEPLRNILRSINRQTHCVVQLTKPGQRDAAIVQIKSKMDLLKQLRDRQNQVRQQELAKREKKPKQIELNWAISENDLGLKLKQLESFLDKGKTVEILLAAKKRQRKASEEEGSNVLNKIKQAIQESGAKEVKPMQGQVLKQATIIVKK